MVEYDITDSIVLFLGVLVSVVVPFALIPTFGGVGIAVSAIICIGFAYFITGALADYRVIIDTNGMEVSIQERTSLRDVLSDESPMVECSSCGDRFNKTENHITIDSRDFCPKCSHIGEIVMYKYDEWFETAASVRSESD